MAGTTLPEKPVRLGLRLTAQDSAAGSAFANVQMREFDEHGVLSCQLEFSGQVLAEGFLALWDPVAPATVYLGPTSASLLSIESHGAEQRFEIRFDAAALESALRELRDQH